MTIRKSYTLAFVCFAGCWTLFLAGAPRATAQMGGPPADAQSASVHAIKGDPARGKNLFEQNCSSCHGVDASGDEGPDLHGVPRSLGDAAVENIIQHGIRGTAMPGFFELKPADAADIVAFLHTFDESTAGAVTGDPQAGKAIYQSSGCSGCHMIDGQGGSIGPDLSRIGDMRGPASLKQRLIDPGANLPQNGTGFYSSKWTEYLMFRAVQKNGQPIEGMRVGENSFVIVLKDATGRFHSLWKPDLRSLAKEPGKSLMPSFKNTLTSKQMDDLVAYLMSLKRAQ
ncbi:MAG TPA: c-type cytochrome [Chloroflexota bacterium]|nr:c-type cytochrome [Chloroflexota bacterium]